MWKDQQLGKSVCPERPPSSEHYLFQTSSSDAVSPPGTADVGLVGRTTISSPSLTRSPFLVSENDLPHVNPTSSRSSRGCVYSLRYSMTSIRIIIVILTSAAVQIWGFCGYLIFRSTSATGATCGSPSAAAVASLAMWHVPPRLPTISFLVHFGIGRKLTAKYWVCEISWCRCRQLAFSQYCISHKTISHQAAAATLKFAVSAPWPNF